MERNRRGDLPQGFSRGFGSRDAAVVSIEPLIHCQPKQSTLGRRSRRPFNFVTRFAPQQALRLLRASMHLTHGHQRGEQSTGLPATQTPLQLIKINMKVQ
jgi:hypothetical protein